MAFSFIKRLFRHLLIWPDAARHYFPADSMRRITTAIASSESTHLGEICFVVELNLHVADIFRMKSAKKRAIEVFSQFHVWDTEKNNGVLIYLLLADRDFEILADRGIHHHVGSPGWEEICSDMEKLFRQEKFEDGVLYGIEQIGRQLTKHYPGSGKRINELSNIPIII